MDPIEQLCHKLNAERTYQSLRQQPTPPETAPPPYTPSDADSDASDDDDDDNEPATPSSSPLKLTINAAHSIQGNNNLVPTSPTPLADATKFSTILLAAVKQLNCIADIAGGSRRARRTVKVDLTINCGVTVIGDRNVVGNVGLKPKVGIPAQATAAPGAVVGCPSDGAAVVGAKRKADAELVEEPEAKRTAVGGAED